jgi:hypothetical protein
MAIKRLNFLGLRRSRACGKCFALVFLLFAMTFVSCIDGEAQSDPVVARHMGAFYEAFLGRNLSGSELRAIVDAFIKGHTKNGKSRTAIHKIAKSFDPYTKILRENEDGPAALTTRHRMIESNYFGGVNSTELQFLTEPDPIRVVDPKSRRLMTERDLVGLVNIRNFAKSNGDPFHRELSRRELDRLAIELNRLFGSHPKAGRLPQFFSETAAFWAGIQQNWSQLNNREKSLARAYANKTWRIRMPAEMYGKLLGLTPQAARRRQMDDVSSSVATANALALPALTWPGW